MDLSSTLFNQPKFRNGVVVNVSDTSIEIDYRNQGCDIFFEDLPSGEIKSLIDALKVGKTSIDELKQDHSAIDEFIDESIMEFDRLGLLTEQDLPKPSGYLSGEDFYYTRLMPAISKAQQACGDSPLYQRFLSDKVTRNELIGFAMEYYHLVKMAPGLIGPSISHVSNEATRKELIKLFVDEYDHDKMMISALSHVDIDEDMLLKRQPLATTFSAYISLGVYARQHILSFFSALFLFETPSHAFNDKFIETCQKMDLPKGFYQPLISHSDINEEGDHDVITLDLLKQVPLISEQEQDTVLIHITTMVEMLNKQDQQIVEYYGNVNNDLLRVY